MKDDVKRVFFHELGHYVAHELNKRFYKGTGTKSIAIFSTVDDKDKFHGDARVVTTSNGNERDAPSIEMLPEILAAATYGCIFQAYINQSENKLPEYATAGASGMDLRASLTAPLTIQPLERTMVPTGLSVEIPDGHEAQIGPRSGLAVKQGITVLNTPGTIDSDYRGEIKVILINLSKEEQTISLGDRIVQMVIMKVEKATLIEVKEINVTERNAGGFGHTGKQ